MRFARLLLVVVLAVSIPLQGFAAASAALCDEQGHHDDAAARAPDHGHGPAVPHSHGKSGEASRDCPPCGASVAITAFAGVFAPPAASSAVDEPAASFVSGAIAERLDRPPLPL